MNGQPEQLEIPQPEQLEVLTRFNNLVQQLLVRNVKGHPKHYIHSA